MSRIKVGDLVQIVKPKVCGCFEDAGQIHMVVDAFDRHPFLTCAACGHSRVHEETTIRLGNGRYQDPWRLKRIPPLDELEGVKTQEPIKETA